MWLYGSGFPKSMNIGLAVDNKNGVESKVIGQNQYILVKQAKDLREGHRKIVDSLNAGANERNNGFTSVSADVKEHVSEDGKKWKGWGTALKPSFEPIIVARKPIKESLIDNIIDYDVGGINIDECRIPLEDDYEYKETNRKSRTVGTVFDNTHSGFKSENNNTAVANPSGRFPANTILTYDETDEEEVCGGFPDTKSIGGKTTMQDLRDVGKKSKEAIGIDKLSFGQVVNADRKESNYIAPQDSGSASRYFYCAKASKKDRDEGLKEFEEKKGIRINAPRENEEIKTKPRKNIHPTVKPTELMQYLVRLVTPKGGTVLDPFNGSGSTGKAVAFENRERGADYKYIGIELDKNYCDISKARIQWASDEYVYLDDEQVSKEQIDKVKKVNNKNKGIRLW